jgi:hypothetical protein
MRRIQLAVILSLFFLVPSCGEKGDPLFDEVMVIHDEVMPKTGYMQKLKTQLEASKSKTTDSLEILNIQNVIDDLVTADDAMFDWMKDFRPPEDKDIRDSYLIEEKIRIQSVSDQMLKSISDAEKLLSIHE